ncbi:aminopeptidase [Mucilaginibacter sp. PPCGB 2223]|uniref:M28 family metallopeptidase n=1 Tax=Mucilaginibacter sp. PPCGB 2223 TaxID=1886027 RepID=UPI000824BE4F|nr:M28 family peptidase [Mucilaginibacter sp. PPCGB 2223]OCX54092.1 aminopeptidase [Mucilaginibacter sp. PPCGB 2223]
MKIKFVLLFILIANISLAQEADPAFGHKMIDTLTSKYFWGRGYTNDGVGKAARFLAGQFKSYGLQPMDGKRFEQPFSFPVNTFPGKAEVNINGTKLRTGYDYIVTADSRGIKTSGTLIKSDSVHFVDAEHRIMVTLQKKLTWDVAQKTEDYTGIEVDQKAITGDPQTIDIDIENKLIPQFKTANICGVVKGTVKPDSIIVITAHYDHLGGMGNATYFPGANDNASGVTLLLALAQYYGTHPQPYTMAFILFSGEEAGLLGSKYFTENPLIKLSDIRFLFNLDLEGTGDEGATVVNSTIYKNEFALLNQVNDQYHYLVKIYPRGKAANSDHYFFTEKRVPAFFMYTMGGIKAYHDVYDISATLPLTKYPELFKLLLAFNDRLMNKSN